MLRDIADLGVSMAVRLTQELNRARAKRLLAQDALEQHGLSRAVSPNHSYEFAGLDVQIEVVPNNPLIK
jgi:hypothetical protein